MASFFYRSSMQVIGGEEGGDRVAHMRVVAVDR
jgi:hypothetical protein